MLADPSAADAPRQDDKVAFPLKVSENRRYLVDAKDKPFFLRSDTPWFNPRTGQWSSAQPNESSDFVAPDRQDWTLLRRRQSQ
ncbi:MAG: hypothetical protein A2Y77_12180 [Planctomycetes bacterium RBG_13_62_9]|nr:MAG: hypothetical protein A2Y77_12180 [Planctomycetes bacterium RBG_13_62_9]